MEKTLLDYLKCVQEQETNRETCEKLIEELENKQIEFWAKHELEDMPEEPTDYLIKCEIKPFEEKEPEENPSWMFKTALICTFVLSVLFHVAFPQIITTIYGLAVILTIVAAIPVWFVFMCILHGVYSLAIYGPSLKKWEVRKRNYEEAAYPAAKKAVYERYQKECLLVEENNVRLHKKSKEFDKKLNKAIDDVKANLYTIKQQLKELYNMDIIYPKYRDIVPVTMFCEYLSSGRCETLRGSNGAYNLYESELRAELIIDRLDNIICALEEIKESQYLLYTTLNRISATVDNVVYQVTSQNALLEEQNFLQEFNTCVVATKLEAQNCIAAQNLKQLKSMKD